MMDAARRKEAYAGIKADIRHFLACRCREQQPVDADCRWLIRRAASAMAVVFTLDARMKIGGPLSPSQRAIYAEACHERDLCLAALAISDPYATAAS